MTDGGQKPLEIAHAIADFVGGAKRSLDLAQYDFNLRPETAVAVGDAIKAAAARGVAVRFIYNVDHRLPIPVPPPPEPDVQLIAALGVPEKPIAGSPDLMHHKYVIRDGESVWTGSMNWTDDSWSRQENVVVVVDSPAVAASFTKDFEQLWTAGNVEDTGRVDPARVDVGGHEVRAWFTPTYGEDLSHRIANAIGDARRRVRICSPVLSAAPVIATLAERVTDGGLDIAGCLDATQVEGVFHDWRADGRAAWKIPLLQRVLQAPFSGKRSAPWTPAREARRVRRPGAGALPEVRGMRILVLGGTKFIGPVAVAELVQAGHELRVFHRGDGCDAPDHVHGDFARFEDSLGELRGFEPEVVVDMLAVRPEHARRVAQFPTARYTVVLSSQDVYRAFGRIWKTEPGPPDPLPIDEDAPLREKVIDESYDKTGMEAALAELDRPVTSIALAVTHGAEETRAYNVGEPETFSEREWISKIAAVTGWDGEVVLLPAGRLPEYLRQDSFDLSQDFVVDTSRVRNELGYSEVVPSEEALRRTVEWERANPQTEPAHPLFADRFDYDAEDTAITQASG